MARDSSQAELSASCRLKTCLERLSRQLRDLRDLRDSITSTVEEVHWSPDDPELLIVLMRHMMMPMSPPQLPDRDEQVELSTDIHCPAAAHAKSL